MSRLPDEEVNRWLSKVDNDQAQVALSAHIEAITEESNIISTAANELREGAAYWQNRALQAEAKSEERKDMLQRYPPLRFPSSDVGMGQAWLCCGRHPKSLASKALHGDGCVYDHALSDDVVEHTEHRWAFRVTPPDLALHIEDGYFVQQHTVASLRLVFCADCEITADKEVK